MNTFATKKIIIACLLASSAASAFAEWTFVSEVDTASLYIDIQSIRKDGNLRKVWQLAQYNQLLKDGSMSRLYRQEYDCKAERRRIYDVRSYSGPMATGQLIYSTPDDSPGNWSGIPPNSPVEDFLKIVCAK